MVGQGINALVPQHPNPYNPGNLFINIPPYDPVAERNAFRNDLAFVCYSVCVGDIEGLSVAQKMEFYSFMFSNTMKYYDDVVNFVYLFITEAVNKESERRIHEQQNNLPVDVEAIHLWARRKSAINSVFALVLDKYAQYHPNQVPISNILQTIA